MVKEETDDEKEKTVETYSFWFAFAVMYVCVGCTFPFGFLLLTVDLKESSMDEGKKRKQRQSFALFFSSSSPLPPLSLSLYRSIALSLSLYRSLVSIYRSYSAYKLVMASMEGGGPKGREASDSHSLSASASSSLTAKGKAKRSAAEADATATATVTVTADDAIAVVNGDEEEEEEEEEEGDGKNELKGGARPGTDRLPLPIVGAVLPVAWRDGTTRT
jgi:hypothetical protein